VVEVEMGPKGKELDVTQSEWFVGGGVGSGVFARIEEEEECNGDHISCGVMVGILTCLCHVCNVE